MVPLWSLLHRLTTMFVMLTALPVVFFSYNNFLDLRLPLGWSLGWMTPVSPCWTVSPDSFQFHNCIVSKEVLLLQHKRPWATSFPHCGCLCTTHTLCYNCTTNRNHATAKERTFVILPTTIHLRSWDPPVQTFTKHPFIAPTSIIFPTMEVSRSEDKRFYACLNLIWN